MKPRATTIIRKDRDGRVIDGVSAMFVYGAIHPNKQFRQWLNDLKVGRARNFDYFLGAVISRDDETKPQIPETLFSVDCVEEIASAAGFDVTISGENLKISFSGDSISQVPVVSGGGAAIAISGNALLSKALIEANEILKGLEGSVAESAPKVEVHDRYISSTGYILPRDAALSFGLSAIEFGHKARQYGWFHSTTKRVVAAVDKVRAGYLVHAPGKRFEQNGEYKTVDQAFFTPAGIIAMRKELLADATVRHKIRNEDLFENAA